ncbi:DUF6603 domain-containing protein [Streptomyces diastatochromogenes]|uniref:DUF6603 domain-containing protein n=1 Tax=Streptomyces diastatochromogenes TaxID=42236 RepID=A0A233S193_STRDA|nr:DUF6603 domain-containing protein [Streptomyces diastatochromogenes]OXY89424.1 hypothetical protein BEK98_38285 [Streptomyces diastatochromogenes]
MAAGTLELLARELARALQPLHEWLGEERRDQFFQELGLWLPGGLGGAAGGIGTVTVQSAGLGPAVDGLTRAIEAGEPAEIVRAGASLVGVLGQVLSAVAGLGPALASAVAADQYLTDAQRLRLAAEVRQLPRRLLDHALITHLEGRSEAVVGALTLTGVVESVPAILDPDDPTRLPVRRRALRLDRLLSLLTDPAGLMREVFGFGTAEFDGLELFRILADHLFALGQPYRYQGPPEQPGLPPAFDVLLTRLLADRSTTPPSLSVQADGGSAGEFSVTAGPGSLWKLAIEAAAAFDAGLRAVVTPPLAIAFHPEGDLKLSAELGLEARRPDGTPMLLIGQAGGSRLELGHFALALGLQAEASAGAGVTAEPSARLDLKGGHLLIDLSEGDGFLRAVTRGGRIESGVDVTALWAPSSGLRLEGSGSLDLSIPVHLELGPVEVTTLYLSVGIGDGPAVPVEISGAFTAEFGPVKAAVDRVGLVVTLGFPKDGGSLGPLDLGFRFKPPNGVGLSVDAGVLSGGGYLYVDAERGEYAGAVELEFAGFLQLKGIGLISTRMPDRPDGFSLLVVITAEFGTGIQLGYGFTLLAVGGIIGLNRAMNLRALTEGVHSGRIESVMFPRDVVANAPRIISDLRQFFPPEDGKFLIGPMAKIGWGTPTLVSVSLGLIIEVPGNLAVLGVLKCVLPTEQLPLLVLQVQFIGAVEFDKSRLWFYARLFESRILWMTIDGGMGLYVAWGDSPDLVLSVGGFHPSYKPPALPFPVPDRLSVDIINMPGRLIRVSGYFAITSNTVQFGAEALLRFGFEDFGIEGHVTFDALFRFSPFAFVISVSASVTLKAFGAGIFGIDLRFQLEGPSPWRAHGRGSISLLFFEISADFDISWGEEHNTTLPPVEVLALLAGEIGKTEGWETRLPTADTRHLVTLRRLADTDDLVLHPRGTLFVRQRSVPLGVRIDRVGAQRPSDGKRFTIAPDPAGGLVQLSLPAEKFAMAQFQDMDDAAKLSRPAYEDQDAGLELSAAPDALAAPRAVRRSARYEMHVFDSRKPHTRPTAHAAAAAAPRAVVASGGRTKRFQNVDAAVFRQLLDGSSTSRSPLSRTEAGRRQPFAAEDTVRVAAQRFVIAYVRNNVQAFPPSAGLGAATFRSQATAEDALSDWLVADPGLAGTLHVIRESEVSAPLAAPNTWTDAAPAPFGAAGGEAVRLAGGAVLLAGGRDRAGSSLASAALFDPVGGVWEAAPDMAAARRGHTVTLLADGRVLVAGGQGTDGGALDSAEIYDPVTRVWSTVAPLPGARFGHSATLLGDGTVLIAGGTGARGEREHASLASAELFDPRTGAWAEDERRPAPMGDARSGHRAVRLSDARGRVLVVGGALHTGAGRAALAYCELYDPGSRTWTPAGSLAVPRTGHQATLLADGTVLVTGGDPGDTPVGARFSTACAASVEQYSPGTDSWAACPDLPVAGRGSHRAVALRTGRVLVFGGTGRRDPAASGLRGAVLYDPAARTWTATGGLATGRSETVAVELADGRVLTTGGLVRSGPATPDGTDDVTATTELHTP